jgi:hypothetical protein
MSVEYRQALLKPWDKSVGSGTSFACGPLEVNVIFTQPEATACALNFAQLLARELGACIRLHAAIAVPIAWPLDQPPVSVAFMQEKLRTLASEINAEGLEPTVHLYLCRNRIPALLQVLKPNSLALLGGRNHWWPTAESRLAAALRAAGHRVILVDSRTRGHSGHQRFERPVLVR